jgi:hypothetical protein
MLPIARILAGASAIFVAALTGCEYYPPPQDASSQNAASEAPASPSTAALEQELKEAQAKLEAARAEQEASGRSAATGPGGASQARTVSTAAPLAPFSAGGEDRIECPAGFMAQESKDTGCACVSSEDPNMLSPFKEPPCSTTARAEGGECIFVCPSANAPAPSPPSP